MSVFEKGTDKHAHLKHIHRDVRVRGRVAEITTRQDFVNESPDHVELVYKYRSSYSPHYLKCEFFDPETQKRDVLIGKIKEKEKAQDLYDDSIAEGNQALLMEKSEEKKMYVINLGNIKPKIEISLFTKTLSPVDYEADDEENSMMFFNIRVKKMAEESKDVEVEQKMSVKVTVDMQDVEIVSLKSQSHPGSLEKKTDVEVKDDKIVVYETKKNVAVTKDFCVRIRGKMLAVSSALLSPVKYKDYKFSSIVSILPNFPVDKKNYAAEFWLIVDCSGSMAGQRIRYCRQALLLFLKSLDPDRNISLNIVCFGSTFKTMYQHPVRIDENNMEKMQEYVKNIDATMGGTDILAPSKFVLGLSDSPKNDISHYVNQDVCTFKFTGEKFTKQKWFHCATCDLVKDVGCCESCVKVCHAGHEVQEARNSPSKFYCDCGAEKKVCKLGDKEFVAQKEEKLELEKQIFLFTDGEDDKEDQIVEMVKQNYVQKKARFFSFGIGNGINKSFCQKIADVSKGSACFIQDNSKMKRKVLGQLSCALQTTIQDIKIELEGLNSEDIKKINSNELKLMFNGTSCNEYYFLKKAPSQINVSYVYEKQTHKDSIRPSLYQSDSSINVVAARKYLKELEKSGKKDEKEITELGLTFNIVTPKTSFFLEKEGTESVSSQLKTVEIEFKKKKKPEVNPYTRRGDQLSSWGSTKSSGRYGARLFGSKKKSKKKDAKSSVIQRKLQFLKRQKMGGASFLSKNQSAAPKSAHSVKRGEIVMIDNRPVKIVDSRMPKTGKHGSSKMFFTAVDVETGKKIMKTMPTHGEIQVVEKEEEIREEDDLEDMFLSADMDEDDENESGELPETVDDKEKEEKKMTPSDFVSEKNLSDLLLESTMRGVFKCTQKICSLIGISLESVKKSCPSYVTDLDLWMTAIVVAVLETFYSSEKVEWKLVGKKSRKCIKMHSLIVDDAQKFVNSL